MQVQVVPQDTTGQELTDVPNRAVRVNVVAGGGSGSNAAAGPTGAAVPGSADYQGVNVGGNLQGAAGFDLDTGAGTEFVQGVSLRKPGAGGSVELGTASNPIRTDPTGATTQPASIADGSDAALGATADAAVAADGPGTVSGKLRGLVKLLAAVIDVANAWLLVNLKYLNGTAIDTNSGNKSAGTQRVVMATDQPSLSNPLHVDGTAAADAAPAGNPLRNGALGRTSLPTVVTAGRVVDILADRYGRLFHVAPVVSNASSGGTPITTNTNTLLVAAPGAGVHLRIHRLWAQNSSATGTWCYFGNGSGVKTVPFFLAQNQPFSMQFEGRWELSSNTGLYLNTAITGANIEWYIEFESLAD